MDGVLGEDEVIIEDDIRAHLYEMERKYAIESNYMTKQPNINIKMRRILLEWITECTREVCVSNDALFLCMNIIDRYLSWEIICILSLQLLGASALFIASKVEDVCPVAVATISHLTDKSCTCEGIRRMEREILRVLEYTISNPTPLTFMHIFRPSLTMVPLTTYILLVSQVRGKTFKYIPSVQALAAVALAYELVMCPYEFTMVPEVAACMDDMRHNLTSVATKPIRTCLYTISNVSDCFQQRLEQPILPIQM